MLSFRLPGSFAFRAAARTFRALLFQEPPRRTRFVPLRRPPKTSLRRYITRRSIRGERVPHAATTSRRREP